MAALIQLCNVFIGEFVTKSGFYKASMRCPQVDGSECGPHTGRGRLSAAWPLVRHCAGQPSQSQRIPSKHLFSRLQIAWHSGLLPPPLVTCSPHLRRWSLRWKPSGGSQRNRPFAECPLLFIQCLGGLSLPVGQCVLPFSQPRECAFFVCRSHFEHCGVCVCVICSISSLCMGEWGRGRM